MNIGDIIAGIEKKKKIVNTLYSEIKEVNKELEKYETSTSQPVPEMMLILPIAYRYLGARIFHWDRDGPVNMIEFSYLEAGKWLSTHYPQSLRHYFMNVSDEAQKRVDAALENAKQQRPTQ